MTDVDRLTAALEGRYRIERELGAGGMATVYLAEDLRHQRQVAIKVLKPELAAVLGADRFVVEIKTTAALQHPHILPLFDSGTADGFLYYVMPYIEGETLRDKLDRETQLGIGEAVRITSEIADALDYAHRQGVIHRDIKPENILLHDGRPMVADFGIALAVSAAAGGRMTETGLSLGTPHYMSPEQATAEKEITGRSDVYSLGTMLYEMLTGNPPHVGASAQQIIMKIVTEEAAPVTKYRRSVPRHVAAAVAMAVEKLPADRFATAADFAEALANPALTMARTGTGPAARVGWRAWLAGGAVAALALMAGFVLGVGRGDPGSVSRGDVVQGALPLGDSVVIRSLPSLRFAVAPSGRRVAFVGPDGSDTQLWVRELDQPAARPLPDTKGAFAPFFSPDGASIGFFAGSGAHTAIKVVPVSGGVARIVVQDSAATYGGGSWGDDGQIYFTRANRGLGRVSSAGGTVTQVSLPDTADGVQEADYPDVLPGSRHAVVMLWRGSPSANHVAAVDLATGVVTDLAPGTMARYLPPGFLVIGNADGQLSVARFDPRKAVLTGPPVPMLQGVQTEAANGTVQFGVSANGILVYEAAGTGKRGLVWVTRDGSRAPVDSALTGMFQTVGLSPDGTQIAVARSGAGSTDVWVLQLATGAFSRLSFDLGTADRPVWTPDGRGVAFLGTRNNRRTAWMRRADGTDSAQAAAPGETQLDEIAFDPLGRFTLLRSYGSGAGTRHLLVMENGEDTVPRMLLSSQFDHYAPAVSPDGRWLAYVSEESGKPEVYVRPFPNVDSARFAISVGGGTEPLWSRDGTELFFRSIRGDEMFAVPVRTGQSFQHGSPTLLFNATGLAVDGYHRAYDVSPDGTRFLMVTSSGEGDASELQVVFNWLQELAQLEDTPK